MTIFLTPASCGGWRGLAAASVLAAVLGFGSGFGLRDLAARAHERGQALAAARTALAAEQFVRAAERKEAQASAALGLKAAQEKAATRAFYSQLLRSTPAYVTPDADRHCTVPSGFVRLYDDAAQGVSRPADPAGGPDDAASGIALSAVAAATAENFGLCREIRGQLTALQDWERTVGR